MKLHLPTTLRTALLAAFVGVSAAFAEDQATTAPAAYSFLYSQTSNPHAVSAEGWAHIRYSAPSVANNSNWALTLTATNITPHLTEENEDGEQYQYATLISRESTTVTITNDNLSNWKLVGQPHAFRIYIAPDGDIALFYQNKNGGYTTTKLDNVKDWDWTSIAELSVTITYNSEEKYLSLTSGYIRRAEEGETKYFNPVENIKYNLPADFFTQSSLVNDENYLRAAVGAGASLTTTLVYESGLTGWRIEGWTILDKMIDGSEYYNVTGTQPEKYSLDSSHRVQFLDNDGVIYLENGTYTYSNATTAIADPASGSSSCSVGFGAAQGASLIIERAALANSVFSTLSPVGVRVVGNGTVEIEMNAGDTINLVELSNSGTLALTNAGAATLNITTADTSRSASITAAKDLTINTGVDKDNKPLGLQARNITVSGGSLTINGNAASTVLANKIAASSQATLVGQYRANEITAGDNLQLGTTASNGAANVTASIVKAGTDIEVNGSLKADEVVAKQLITKKVTVATTSATAATLLSGNVSADSSGIKANTLTSANIIVDGDTIATAASTEDRISITGTTLTAGALTAGTIDLQGSYNMGATEITAAQVIDGTTNISGAVTIENAAVYTNDAGKRLISASSIKADTVAIGENTLLIGADVTATNEMTIAQGSSVQNASINAGTFFVIGDNASLSNVVLNKGTLTNGSSVNVENLTVVTNAAPVNLGGTGNAVQIEGNIESVQLSGTLNDDFLVISKLTLNGEGLDFDNIATGGTDYAFISGEDLEYDYDASRDQLNIKSFVRAELDTTTDVNGKTIITIKGQEDEAGIKQALADTHNRTEAIKAIDEALEGAPSTFAARATTAQSPLQEIHEYVGHVMRYDETNRKDVLSAASGASLAALADSQRRGLRDVQDNLRNRIIQMGGGTSAGLTTDWEYVGLQAWAQADGGLASTSGSGDEWGYDYDTMGATVGANIDLTANTVIGMSFSASYGEITVDDSTDHAKGNNDAQYISFFARHNKERWVQMFIFTYGMNEMDMERSVLGYNAKGDTKGETFSAYYELGYTLGIDYEYEHIVQPLVSVSFTSASVDAFEEAGSIGNAGINYANNTYFYGQVAIGARYQGVLYETIHERNAVVEARALVTHDFGDTTNEASVALAGSKEYTVKGADSSGMGFKIGAGLSIPVEQHTTLYADVDYTSAPDYSGFRGNIGVRYDF
ncbi:MAG: autotransporter domain-containing protein [Akkermansia sp.]|nr:autotransporter domain-containing protein [Akkermansia sp.]